MINELISQYVPIGASIICIAMFVMSTRAYKNKANTEYVKSLEGRVEHLEKQLTLCSAERERLERINHRLTEELYAKEK